MTKTSIIPAIIDHAAIIACNVRPADKEELWAGSMTNPFDAMKMGLAFSDAMTGTVDGVPVCMFGVSPQSWVGRIGVPWMVGTRALDAHAIHFLRRNKGWIKDQMQIFDKLVNYVDARNLLAINWLTWLGFTIHEPELYGAFKLPFHKFVMEK